MKMSIIQNLQTYNPFADEQGAVESHVHIRVQQRTGKKMLTTIQGLPEDLDSKKVLKYFKDTFHCGGKVSVTQDLGTIIMLQGDQRKDIYDFLVSQEIVSKEKITIHGT